MAPRLVMTETYVMKQITYDVHDHPAVRWVELTMTDHTAVMVRTIDRHGRPAETFYPRLPDADMPAWILEAVRAAESEAHISMEAMDDACGQTAAEMIAEANHQPMVPVQYSPVADAFELHYGAAESLT